MSEKLTFEFIVNKESNSVTIIREFAAGTDLVWAAWTESEILDQWWAPKPWKSKTKSMDFKQGGSRLYAMCGPDGEEHWCITRFNTIDPKIYFDGSDCFSDENGTVNPEFPQSDFNMTFEKHGEHTMVTNRTTYPNLEALEMTINMGFKEGMTMALEGLDDYLASVK